MAYATKVIASMAAVLLPQLACAGGAYEAVLVKSLRITNEVDYELVVAPIPREPSNGYKDPYMGTCSTFTVQGTYARLYSALRLPAHVTRQAHVAALSYLRKAFESGRPANLGWMGTGFVAVDPKIPCVVRSRALQLFIDRGETSVISRHNAV